MTNAYKLIKNLPLCECGDALERIGIERVLEKPFFLEGKKIVKIVDHYLYYCLGCNAYYRLVKTTEEI